MLLMKIKLGCSSDAKRVNNFFVASIVSVMVLFSNTVLAATPASAKIIGGDYRAPLTSEPATLDPAQYSDIYSMQVANAIYDGLVAFNEDLSVVPAIARRWKISRDHRTYTFLLRKGVKFHNGREVTSADFVYSFTRLLNPEIKSPAASFFLAIKGAKAYQEGASETVIGLSAPEPLELKIELETPFAPFLSILAMANAKVVPQEAVDADFSHHPIGTGPFRFTSWQAGQEILLTANDDYYAGRPALDRVHFRIYPNINWETIFTDFQQGKLDHAIIPSTQYDALINQPQDNSDYVVVSKPGLNLVYVGMNQAVAPFDDLRVRQAINYAVDTEALVKTVAKRGTTPANGILPPGIAGYDPSLRGYGYNPERARTLLAAAGYPQGAGFPTIQLWTVSKSQSVHNELAEYKRYLAAVGLNVEIKVADNWKAFVQAISEKKAAMFYAAWYADYPDADNFFYPLTHSSSRTNRMGFADPQLDQLLDQARQETDFRRRAALYREAEQLAKYGAPIVSQHVNSSSYLFRSLVQGVTMSPLGIVYMPLQKLWFSEPSGADVAVIR